MSSATDNVRPSAKPNTWRIDNLHRSCSARAVLFVRAQLPRYLPQHSQQYWSIIGVQLQAPDQAPQLLFRAPAPPAASRIRSCAEPQAAFASTAPLLVTWRKSFLFSRAQFLPALSSILAPVRTGRPPPPAQIHRTVLLSRRNPHHPMAVAQFPIRQVPTLSEPNSNATGPAFSCRLIARAPSSSRRNRCCNSRRPAAVVPTTSLQSATASATFAYCSAFASNPAAPTADLASRNAAS